MIKGIMQSVYHGISVLRCEIASKFLHKKKEEKQNDINFMNLLKFVNFWL